MWLLFLVIWQTHCDYFDCSKDIYTCCVNEELTDSLNEPGYYCLMINAYGTSSSARSKCVEDRDFYIGNSRQRSNLCCVDYTYVPSNTSQLMPQLTQTPQRTLNVATKQSKKSTDFLVTFATSIFD